MAEPDNFAVIVADPPWPERGGGKIKRGADKHYDLMKRSDILAAMLRADKFHPAPDCLMFMWSTMMSLVDSLWVMDGLGFRYVTHGVWVKTKADLAGGLDISIGQYLRGAHELFLIGVRGSGFAVRSDDKSIPSVLMAPAPRGANGRRIHSRKPDAFYRMIERRTIGPKLDMFARVARGPEWSVWGDQAPEETDTDEVDDLGMDAADEAARDATSQEPEAA